MESVAKGRLPTHATTRHLAGVVGSHPKQGWSLPCIETVLFDDDGESTEFTHEPPWGTTVCRPAMDLDDPTLPWWGHRPCRAEGACLMELRSLPPPTSEPRGGLVAPRDSPSASCIVCRPRSPGAPAPDDPLIQPPNEEATDPCRTHAEPCSLRPRVGRAVGLAAPPDGAARPNEPDPTLSCSRGHVVTNDRPPMDRSLLRTAPPSKASSKSWMLALTCGDPG